MMRYSFNIGRFLVRPGRKLHGFLIKLKIRPGVLSKLSAIPAEQNIVIPYLAYSADQSGETAIALAFLDFTNSDISPKELVRKVKQYDFVEEVIIIKPKINGFIADTVSNPLTMSGDRAVIFREPGYKGLLASIRKFGPGIEVFLYYLGVEAGLEFGKKHKETAKKLGIAKPEEIYRNISESMFNCVGYGLMETVKIKTRLPYAIIRVHNCFECELGIGTGKPFSHLVRGMIAGVLTALLGVKMTAIETKCIAKGDPYCEFEVKPKK